MKICISALAIAAMLTIVQSCTAADPAENKRADSASEKLGMKLSLQCWTFNKLTFFETVDKAKGLGIKYLEIYPGQKLKPGSDVVVNKDMSEETIAEIKKKLADAGGLKLVAYGVDGIAPDEKGTRKEFEWAKKMGIEVIVTETTPNETLDTLCMDFKIRLALHNHPRSWPPDQVLKATKNLSKMVGSCSDTGHWMRAKYIPVDTLKKLEGRVEHLHFKDLNDFGGDAHDVPWGTGKGDVKGMLTELKRQGYKGYLSIEYEFGDIKHLDENLPKCVEFFDKTMAELAKPTLPPGKPGEQIKALIKECDDAWAEFRKKFEAAKSDEEEEKLFQQVPDREAYAELLVEIAQKNPKEPAAFDALIWAVRNSSRPPNSTDTPFARAKAALVKDHFDNPGIGPLCMTLRHDFFDLTAKELAETLLTKHPDKKVQAQAAYALACLLDARGNWSEFLKKMEPKQLENMKKTYGNEAIDDIRKGDKTAQKKQAEELLEKITKDKELAAAVVERGDQKLTVGELAQRQLFEWRELQPGKPAPDITGEDIDGKPFKLSDYKGKVVLLDFWGHW
jgi:sugar phosphate isomerase/epimerase